MSRRLLALASLLVVAGCATLGGANYYSVQEEWQAGRQLEAEINRQLSITNDATLNNYVRQMGRSMVARTSMRNQSWRFYVVRDDAINAFNVPGGLVYINTGLIAQAGSAAELAGAVAHEIGHGVARHGTSRLSKARDANAAAAVLGVGNSGLGGLAANVAAQGAFASFSRADERAADRLGVEIMAGAGYNPDGLAALLQRLASQEGRGGGVKFFRSHPLSSDRVRTVQQLSARVDKRGLRMNDSGFDRVRRRAAQL